MELNHLLEQQDSGEYIKIIFQCVKFPPPPLTGQKRIVAKIEELLPYIKRYEQAWSKYKKFNSRFPEDMKNLFCSMLLRVSW